MSQEREAAVALAPSRATRPVPERGAVLLHDAARVVPATDATEEAFRWLAAEIAEVSGEASVWRARLAHGQDDADRDALSRRHQSLAARDYFRSALGR